MGEVHPVHWGRQQPRGVLITNDENGFDTTEAAVLHYRVKAGEAEICEGVLLPDTMPFGQQFYWSGTST